MSDAAPIRTLAELVDVVQELIDSTGKHVYADDLRDVLARVLGSTGQFPRGPADVDDEGELRLACAADFQQAIVRIEFGKPVASLGLPSKDARDFAKLLIKHADALDRRKT